MTGIEITAVDHVYLTVSDFTRSQTFYDELFLFMGFKKGDMSVGGDPHAHYFNRVTQISIRPARSDVPHDPYLPGLHHLCLRVRDAASVERVATFLEEHGIPHERPSSYPEYAPDYYAVFFRDPDGLRFEVVAERQLRRDIIEKWPLLKGFLNPLSRLKNEG
jgi:glyoxylase I family protein